MPTSGNRSTERRGCSCLIKDTRNDKVLLETQTLELGHAEEDRQKGGGDNARRLAPSLRSLARLPRVATRAAPVGHHGQRPGGGGTAGRTLRKTTNARKPPLAHQGHVHTQGGGGNAGRLARSLSLTRSLAPRCHPRRLRGRHHGHGGTYAT